MNSKKIYSITEAQSKMEKYCAYQERCHQEVAQKLREMQLIPQAVEKITLHLLENDFLNETRFATTYARGKFRIKKWGRNRIINELKKKGISAYNIQLALKEFSDEAYINTFESLAEKGFSLLKTSSKKTNDKYAKRKQLTNYLLYRGWESDMVYEKVVQLIP